MLKFNINLTSMAVILWSGMLIISGAVLILSSQVRKVADLLEEHSKRTAAADRQAKATPAARTRAASRRSTATRARRVVQVEADGSRVRR